MRWRADRVSRALALARRRAGHYHPGLDATNSRPARPRGARPLADVPRVELQQRLRVRFEEVLAGTDRKVSIVGQSLGGVFARILAHEFPDGLAHRDAGNTEQLGELPLGWKGIVGSQLATRDGVAYGRGDLAIQGLAPIQGLLVKALSQRISRIVDGLTHDGLTITNI